MKMRRSSRRAVRGQAITEMALGSLVFISVLSLGIYLAEVGFLSLKVQEAAISALWDGTSGKMHNIPITYSQAGGSMRNAANRASERYADFNGLTSAVRPSMQLVFTRGSNLSVNCDMGNGPEFDGAIATRLVYRDNEGTTCGAQARLSNVNFPRSFMDDGSTGAFFQEKNLKDRHTQLQVCGVGRPVGTACPARYSMMIDDWGLASTTEVLPCQMIGLGLTTCTNPQFAAAVFGVYLPLSLTVFPRSAGTLMAVGMTGFSPIGIGMASLGALDEHAFFMSAGSEETQFMQLLPPLSTDIQQGSPLPWGTTPGAIVNISTAPYSISYVTRDNCFLGRDCVPY